MDIGDKAEELKITWEGADRDGDGHITLNEYLEQVGFLAVSISTIWPYRDSSRVFS